MKFMSWNVNGFRAALRHGFVNTFMDLDADIFGIQDTRLHPDELSVDLPGYYQYWNYAERKGYAGTAVFTKKNQLLWLMASVSQKLMAKEEVLL